MTTTPVNIRNYKIATDAYAAKRAEIAGLIEDLHRYLDAQAARHALRPGDWGYVGDLDHIAARLREAFPAD